MTQQLRLCKETDLEAICSIINDGAQAYRGAIPADCLHDPYMPLEELQAEIADGVQFWGYEDQEILIGVMGLQNVRDVTLIRHAYVRTRNQKQGVGGSLLSHLQTITRRPILIGTWADATWAIRFYERHGFQLVDGREHLLRKYWRIPDRQIETSVVLADRRWSDSTGRMLPCTGQD